MTGISEQGPRVNARADEFRKGRSMMDSIFAVRGNGKAIHVLTTNGLNQAVTVCDKWATGNALGGRQKGRVRPVVAESATCKKCIKG